MQIGISLMEYMSFAAAITGACWVTARVRKEALAKREKKPLWVSFGADFFIVIAIVLFCRVAIADWQVVPSSSMEPTLRVGDRILVNKLAYGPRLPFTNIAIKLGEPARGDVVVFRYPEDVSTLYVKRLIGLPDDVVSYNKGIVRINDQAFNAHIDESIVTQPEDGGQLFVHETAAGQHRIIKVNQSLPGSRITPRAWLTNYRDNCVVISSQQWQCKVPQGKYLMMGDNRDNSSDSRVWGFLDQEQVYGKATRVLINFSHMDRSWTSL